MPVMMPLTALADEAPALRLAGSGPAFRGTLCEMIDCAPLFSDLAWHEIEALSQWVSALEADPGTVLFHEGEPGRALYVLVSGRVRMTRRSDLYADVPVSAGGAGRAFGEAALVDGELRSASCIVEEPSTLLCLTREALARLARQHPEIALKVTGRIARLMSRRLRLSGGRLIEHLDV